MLALFTSACAASSARTTIEAPAVSAADCAGAFDRPLSFAIHKAQLRAAGASEQLIAKLDASPHRYFRFLALEFSSRSCSAFSDVRWNLPVVAIHGDAHVEQFVVTGSSYGLEDFDQAGFGPAVVDLIRYATSLRMVCREVKWPCRGDEVVRAYFEAYRESLASPPDRSHAPRVVERLRARAPLERSAWLAWADRLFGKPDPNAEALYRERWKHFVDLQVSLNRQRPSSFYDVTRIGPLEMGLGSALEKKILFRIRGESDRADDDLILEARSTVPPLPYSCTWRPSYGGSLHTFMFMTILSSRLPEVIGIAAFDDDPRAPEYWIQAWDSGYAELSIADLAGEPELEELARDAAAQLAGHFWKTFPAPLVGQQRYAQLRAFDMVHERAFELSRTLADEVAREWEQFRAEP